MSKKVQRRTRMQVCYCPKAYFLTDVGERGFMCAHGRTGGFLSRPSKRNVVFSFKFYNR